MGRAGVREQEGEPSPKRVANDISSLLNQVLGADRFPVDVKEVAQEYSRQKFPEDPITLIKGDSLPGFEGGLFRAPAGKEGWGILYNTDIRSEGRVNFTLAHEFGHYLLHRERYPEGVQCSSEDMIRWDTEYGQIEQQANTFAATLLMPLDDFRRQIDPKARPTLDDLGACARHYNVSLTAATLRWLGYTERRSVLVISRDGFVLWGRSSERAFKSGAYLKTTDRPPIPIPETSLAAQPERLDGGNDNIRHDKGVWLREPCQEVALISDEYDFAISLLHLEDALGGYIDEEELLEID